MALPTLQQYVENRVEGRHIAYQTPLISQEQYNCIEQLVRMAAFDDDIQHRLVYIRDEALRDIYHLSAITWGYLKAIEADTLEEFCSQVLRLQDKTLNH
jgi:hypothetical protein